MHKSVSYLMSRPCGSLFPPSEENRDLTRVLVMPAAIPQHALTLLEGAANGNANSRIEGFPRGVRRNQDSEGNQVRRQGRREGEGHQGALTHEGSEDRSTRRRGRGRRSR